MAAAAPGTALPRARGLTRSVSLIYEVLLLFAILFAASFVYLLLSRLLSLVPPRSVYQLYLLVVAGVYFAVQWTRGGQTLPMKTWHIKLVSRDGGTVSYRAAVVRYVAAVAGSAALGIGFWWALVDRDRQFLHDRLAGTRLVSVQDI